MRIDLSLHCCHAFECAVPAQFQLGRDQAIVRMTGVVFAEGPISGVTRGFEVERQGLTHLVTLLGFLLLRLQSGLNRRLDHS